MLLLENNKRRSRKFGGPEAQNTAELPSGRNKLSTGIIADWTNALFYAVMQIFTNMQTFFNYN